MRCKNCGWENPDGNQKCERCSSPLDNAVSSDGNATYRPNATESGHTPNLRSTVRELSDGPMQSVVNERPASSVLGETVCNNCGYKLSTGMNVCPQCGMSQKRQPTASHQTHEKQCPKCGSKIMSGARFCPSCGQPLRNSATVNAWDNTQNNSFCSLRPISWSRENITYNPISFSGDRIVLNRANTDPNNQSITSHEQAALTYDGKDWYIEDLSEQHSTMLRVAKKTKLEAGDIIALGNRLFEFQN